MPQLDQNRTLFEALKAAAARDPDAPALTFLDAALRPTSYSYQALFERSSVIADGLKARGAGPGATIGILLQSQEHQVLHYLAALSVGCLPAILTPPNRKLNRVYYLQGLRALLTTCRFSAVISDLQTKDLPATILEPFTLEEIQQGPDGKPCKVEDAALIQFSSGTTGFKKGVVVTNRAVLLQMQSYATAIAMTPEDRIVSWLPLYHDMGFMGCLNLPLALGAHCIMLNPLHWVADPVSFLRAVSSYRGTLGWNPNFAYALMADRVQATELAALELSSLRGLGNGGEPVTYDSQQRFHSRFAACGLRPDVFWGGYGMAETVFAFTHGCSGDAGALDYVGPLQRAGITETLPFVSTGRAFPGVELKIVDLQGEALPDRNLGEILVRSPFTFTGYYQHEEDSAQIFRDGWYPTGDLGYRVEGEIFVCGRSKDMLIVGGVNVFPQDIEDLASSVEGIRPGRAVAFSKFDPLLQTEKIIVLAESSVSPEAHTGVMIQLRQQILAVFQIANFEVHLVPPEWLIKSSSGKMARKGNRAKWLESH